MVCLGVSHCGLWWLCHLGKIPPDQRSVAFGEDASRSEECVIWGRCLPIRRVCHLGKVPPNQRSVSFGEDASQSEECIIWGKKLLITLHKWGGLLPMSRRLRPDNATVWSSHHFPLSYILWSCYLRHCSNLLCVYQGIWYAKIGPTPPPPHPLLGFKASYSCWQNEIMEVNR